MSEEEFPKLESYSQLPLIGDAVFEIGDALVRFTAREQNGTLLGWTVNTGDPGYEGTLIASNTTQWVGDGPEPVHVYSHEERGTQPGQPAFRNSNPTDVTVAELKSLYFGVHE